MSAAAAPTRFAHPSSPFVHEGMPAGRSSARIGGSSAGVKSAPYGASCAGASAVSLGRSAVMAVFHCASIVLIAAFTSPCVAAVELSGQVG